MRTYCVAQGTLLRPCGNLNGKEIQSRGNIGICITDPLCCTAETNTALQSDYTPIRINKRLKFKAIMCVLEKRSRINEKRSRTMREELLFDFQLYRLCLSETWWTWLCKIYLSPTQASEVASAVSDSLRPYGR